MNAQTKTSTQATQASETNLATTQPAASPKKASASTSQAKTAAVADQPKTPVINLPARFEGSSPQHPVWHQEAEETLIGTCFKQAIAGDQMPFIQASESIEFTDFYDPRHRQIWRSLNDLMAEEKPITTLTLQDYFEAVAPEQKNQLLSLALQLAPLACRPNNLQPYIDRVKEDSLRRKLTSLTGHLQAQARDPQQSVNQLLQQTGEQLLSLMPRDEKALKNAELLVDDFAQVLVDRFEGKLSPLGLQTGITEIDQRTLGLHPGQLVVLAARPAMGKTTLAMNWIKNALQQNKPVLFASMEMTHHQLTEHFVSLLSGLTGEQIKDPGGCYTQNGQALTDEEFDRVTNAMGQLKLSPLELLEQGSITTQQLRTQAKKLHHQYQDQGGVGLIVVDYLQLLDTKNEKKNDNRTQVVSRQSRALKLLALELNCPVLCISQLSREVEKRPDKRPIPSDLRDSGSIEQDADVILFIYRDEVYNPSTHLKGVAELLLSKVREGRPGRFYVRTDLSRYQFSDLDPHALQQLMNPAQPAANQPQFSV